MGLEISNTISLDLYQDKYIMVTVTQYDIDSRTLTFNVTSNGSKVDLSSGVYNVSVAMTKPDNTIIIDNCTINSDGTASILITKQMCTVAGVITANLVITETESAVTHSMKFYINVKETVVDEDTVTSSSEYGTFEDGLAEIAYLKNAKDEVESYMNATEQFMNATIESEGKAETSATNAATSEANAAQSATDAAASATAAAQSASNASTSEENTKGYKEDVETWYQEILDAKKGFTTVSFTYFQNNIELVAAAASDTYIISDDFTIPESDTNFVNPGTSHSGGTCIYRTTDSKWDTVVLNNGVSSIKVADGDVRTGAVDLSEELAQKAEFGKTISLEGATIKDGVEYSTSLGDRTVVNANGSMAIGESSDEGAFSLIVPATHATYGSSSELLEDLTTGETSNHSNLYVNIAQYASKDYPWIEVPTFEEKDVDYLIINMTTRNLVQYPYASLPSADSVGKTYTEDGITFTNERTTENLFNASSATMTEGITITTASTTTVKKTVYYPAYKISATGTAKNDATFHVCTLTLESGVAYCLGGCLSDDGAGNWKLRITDSDSVEQCSVNSTSPAIFIPSETGSYNIEIVILKGTEVSGVEFKPALEYGYYFFGDLLPYDTNATGYDRQAYKINAKTGDAYIVGDEENKLTPVVDLGSFSIAYSEGDTLPTVSLNYNYDPEDTKLRPINGKTNTYGKYFFNTSFLPLSVELRIEASYTAHVEANEQCALAGGIASHANGTASIALGLQCESVGAHSVAFGTNNIALNNDQLVVGRFNEVNAGQLFTVGNGSWTDESQDMDRSNAFEVYESGAVTCGSISTEDGFKSSEMPTLFLKKTKTAYVQNTSLKAGASVKFSFADIAIDGYVPLSIYKIDFDSKDNYFTIQNFALGTTTAWVRVKVLTAPGSKITMTLGILYVREGYI